jgi:outer membrane protein assembly factor BamB
MNSVYRVGVLTLILALSLISAIAYTEQVDWTAQDYDATNSKHVVVPGIDTDVITNLVQESFLPLPPGTAGIHGVTHPPLTRRGVGYLVTNGFVVIAFDLRGGKVLWTISMPRTSPVSDQIRGEQLGPVTNVKIVDFDGIEALAVGTPQQTVVLLDIYTGRLLATVSLIGPGERIEGNGGKYGGYPVNFVYDSKRRILIVGSTAPDGPEAGRGFVDGYRLTSRGPEKLWRTFLMPPQLNYDPSWSINFVQSLKNAWIFDGNKVIDLKAIDQETLRMLLSEDWSPGGREVLSTGVMASWMGGWAVDETSGVVYLAVSQPLPSFNGRDRKGPNFPSSSVIAIESATGKAIWVFQAIPHDVYGYGCNSDVLLVGGLVVTACGNGFLYAMDKTNGNLKWFLRPPINKSEYKPPDPFNSDEMSRDFPSNTGTIELSPPPASIFSLAANPSRGLIFYSQPVKSKAVTTSARYELDPPEGADAMLLAVDASTGQIRWSRILKGEGVAHLTVVNDFVLALTYAGNLYIFASANGELTASRSNIGPAMASPSLGTDVEGNLRVILSMSAPNNPGYLLILRPLISIIQETVRTVITITMQTTAVTENPIWQFPLQSVLLLVVSSVIMIVAIALLVKEKVLKGFRKSRS